MAGKVPGKYLKIIQKVPGKSKEGTGKVSGKYHKTALKVVEMFRESTADRTHVTSISVLM